MPVMNIACSVCTDVFNNSDDIYSTSCGHIYHFICMRDWQSRATSCPQCRSYNPTTHKLYLSFDDSDENTKEIDELKAKVQRSTEEIKQLEDQIMEADSNFLHLQEQYTTSVELIRELEERIRQANYDETDFLHLQKQYTSSDNIIKELQEEVLLLTVTNEFNAQEVSLKDTEISTLKTSLGAIECPASDVILYDKIKILEQKLKHLSAEFEKEITKSTQLSIDNMKLQSYIDRMKLKANLNESIQMVNGDNSIVIQQTNESVDHSSDLKEKQFMNLASNIGANIKECAKRENLKKTSVLDPQTNNTLSMGTSPLSDIPNSIESALNSPIGPLTCRQNEVFSSNNITSVVLKDFPVNQVSYPLENIIIDLASKMDLTITKEDLSYVCEMKGKKKRQLPNVILFVQFKSLDLKNKFLLHKNRLKDNPTTKCLTIKEYIDDLTYSVFMYANRKLRAIGFRFVLCKNNQVFAKKHRNDNEEIRIYSKAQVDELLRKNTSSNESA